MESKSIELDNGEILSYNDYNEGLMESVVLLHGNQLNKESFEYIVGVFKGEFRILAVDMRGFGKSSYNRPITSLYDYAYDIIDFVKKLKLVKPNLLGFSTGGGISLITKIIANELIGRVVLLAPTSISGIPFFRIDEQTQKRVRCKTLEEIKEHPYVLTLQEWVREKKSEEIIALLKSNFNCTYTPWIKKKEKEFDAFLENCANSWYQQRSLLDTLWSLIKVNLTSNNDQLFKGDGKIHQLKEKVLLLHGEEDKVVPFKSSIETKKILGDLCELVPLKGWGHNLIFHEDPQIFDKIRAFIQPQAREKRPKF